MNIYVCARWGRRDEARRFAKWVELYLPREFKVVCGWLRSGDRDDDSLSDAEKARVAEQNLGCLRVAGVVVVFTEGPEVVAGGQRGGRHVELGAALALGKRVFIVGPRENIFCWLPNVRQVEKYWHAINILATAEGRRESMFPEKFDFGMALCCLRNGQPVTRAEWDGPGRHVSMRRPENDGVGDAHYLFVCNVNSGMVPWEPSHADLMAEDWMLFPPQSTTGASA